MLVDWQDIAVLLIVLAALAYVGRRGWARVRSMRVRGSTDAACATGCGSCSSAGAITARPASANIVQIERTGGRRPVAR